MKALNAMLVTALLVLATAEPLAAPIEQYSHFEQNCSIAEDTEPQPIEPTVIIIEEQKEYSPDVWDCIILARLIWGEGNNLPKMEKAAIVWCVLNRIDAGFGATVEEVVTQYGQFSGYHEYAPVYEDNYAIAEDVLTRWHENLDGRVLPKEYLWFRGFKWKEKAEEFGLKKTKSHNWYFTESEYHKEEKERTYWDWSLPNPYETNVPKTQ